MLYGETENDDQETPEDEGDQDGGHELKNQNFLGLKLMKSFSIRHIKTGYAPDPKTCIIEMINVQLKVILCEKYRNVDTR